MKRSEVPRPMGKILEELIDTLGIRKKLAESKVCMIWNDVVGKKLSSVTSVGFLRRGKLYIHVKTPSWRNELIFLKRAIIKRLNENAGDEVVKDIIFLSER